MRPQEPPGTGPGLFAAARTPRTARRAALLRLLQPCRGCGFHPHAACRCAPSRRANARCAGPCTTPRPARRGRRRQTPGRRGRPEPRSRGPQNPRRSAHPVSGQFGCAMNGRRPGCAARTRGRAGRNAQARPRSPSTGVRGKPPRAARGLRLLSRLPAARLLGALPGPHLVVAVHGPQVSSAGRAGWPEPRAHREPGVTGAGRWRVFHAARRAAMMAMPQLKFAAAAMSRAHPGSPVRSRTGAGHEPRPSP